MPDPGSGPGSLMARFREMKRERRKVGRVKEEDRAVPSLAELKLSAAELRRLRTVGIGEKRKLKLGKAGITEGIVNGIHERWRRSEVVKIVCEDICKMNMKRTHEVLEVCSLIWLFSLLLELFFFIALRFLCYVNECNNN